MSHARYHTRFTVDWLTWALVGLMAAFQLFAIQLSRQILAYNPQTLPEQSANLSIGVGIIAIAAVEAPFCEHDPEAVDPDEYRDTIMNVVDLHPEFVAWAEARADAVSRGGDTGKSFLESAMEAAASTTSPETNG